MNITFMKKNIVDGLQKASGILPARTGTAYLRSVWLKAEENQLVIMATDANIEFSGAYPAEVSEPGLVGVHGRSFVDLIRQLPDGSVHLSLDAESGNLRIEQGRRKYTLPVNEAVWFQNFSEFPNDGVVMWSGESLQNILERVVFCISDDESMNAIACLYMKNVGDGRIEACGLNGHQFALSAFVHEDLAAHLPETGLLLQKKYMQELKKWLGNSDIEVAFNEKRFYLRTADGRETLSLPRATEYTYPDYPAFMEKLKADTVSRLNIDRKECMDALSRISIFNTDNDRCAYLALTSDEVVISAQGQDVGSANESMEVSYDGTISRIAFPPRNLMEIMGHFSSPQLDIVFTTTDGPCGITGQDDVEYHVLIMPMKIAETTYYAEEED